MLINQQEPDKSKPCWVLFDRGAYYGRLKLVLREYAWREYGAWRETDTPSIVVTSLNKALQKADWIGRLPQQGRKRYAMTKENYDKALPLVHDGKSVREIARVLGIGHSTATQLVKGIKQAL